MRKLIKNSFSGGSALVASLFLANFCNFLFNAFLGRSLSFEQFGLVTLVTTIWNLISILFGALGGAVNYRIAYINSHDGKEHANIFYKMVVKNITILTIVVSLLWVILTPILARFFQVSPSILWYSTPIFIAGGINAAARGYLMGVVAFGTVGVVIGLESLLKLGIGGAFVGLNSSSNTFLAVPLSIVLICVLTVIILRNRSFTPKDMKANGGFPLRFFFASLISGLAVTAFLSVDVILAKHYLSPQIAGEYAFLALVGKMVFFLGSLLNNFVITLVARDEGAGKDHNKTFYRLLAGIVGMTLVAYLGVGVFGSYTVPLLFGAKAFAIIPFLGRYSLAIAIYTVSSFIVQYHVARKHYVFSFLGVIMAVCVVVGITLYHKSIFEITDVLLTVSIVTFFITALFHFLDKNGIFLLRNFVDLVDVFFPKSKTKKADNGKFRILIFNWRDTRHVFAGGAEVYIQELAKRWVKKGHVVTIFCGNDAHSKRNEVIDGVEVVRRGGAYLVYFWAFVYYVVRFRGQYDVIIDSENGIPFFTPIYARIPVLLLIHHVHQEIFREHLVFPLSTIGRFLEAKAMPFIYRNNTIVTVSESSKSEIVNLGLAHASKVEIVHPGIETEQFYVSSKTQYPSLLCLGRLKAYKNIDVAIKAFANVLKTHPKAHLSIVGEGEMFDPLRELAASLKIQDKVTFYGKISHSDKAILLAHSWLVIQPSQLEGWGITVIEANASGTPVIAANVPGLRDSIVHDQTGILVEARNIEAFSRAMHAVLSNDTLRESLSKSANEWSSNFNWDASAKTFNAIIVSDIERSEFSTANALEFI